jgi:asparagine synthase (glutamine-hydrolysing)
MVPKMLRLGAPGDRAQKLADILTSESAEALFFQVLSHWENPAEVVLNSHEAGAVRQSIAESQRSTIEEVMMLTDLKNYLPDDVLTKVDRASMAVGLEARVPFLDHRVVEFSLKLPLHFKIRGGSSKWILREVLHKYVPPEIVRRPKMGFGVPIDRWLRGPLRDWAEDLLSVRSLSQHGLLNVQLIRRKWQEHLAHARNWQYLLWDVLIFQFWLRETNRSLVNETFHQTCNQTCHQTSNVPMSPGMQPSLDPAL